MRSLLWLSALLVLQAAVGYDCAPGARLTFSSSPYAAAGDSSCVISSSPVPMNGSRVLTSYHCGNPMSSTSWNAYVGVTTPTGHAELRSTSFPGQTFAAPINVGNTGYILAYTAGGGSNYELCKIKLEEGDERHSIHTFHGMGYNMSMPSYSVEHDQAFFAIGTGVKGIHLDTGAVVWEHSIQDIQSISNVVFLHGLAMSSSSYVYFITEMPNGAPYINKAIIWKPASQTMEEVLKAEKVTEKSSSDPTSVGFPALSNVQTVINPCGVTAAPGEHFQLESVQFGTDANGPLRGMFMYGNYQPQVGSKFTKPNFMVCRFSHHNISKYEHSWGFNDHMTVLGVTGGDNATIFNVFNDDTQKYEILILNQTVSSKYSRNTITTRNSQDKFNNPVILYGTASFNRAQPVSPRLIIQQSAKATNGLEVVAYETWWGYNKAAWWNDQFGCYNTPAVIQDPLNTEIAYCNDDHQATAFDYNGTIVWAQSGSYNIDTNPIPITLAGNRHQTILFQSGFSIMGYSIFPASPAQPEDKDDDDTAGRVVLALFLILLFGGIFAGVGYYVWKQGLLTGAKRSALPEAHGLNNEGGYGSVAVAEDTEKV